jgi:hypothetical protein
MAKAPPVAAESVEAETVGEASEGGVPEAEDLVAEAGQERVVVG